MTRRISAVLKIILTTVLAAVLFIGNTLVVSADEGSGTGGSSYQIVLKDDAGLLSDEEEERVREAMSSNLNFGNMVFITTDDTQGYDAKGFAENQYYSPFGDEPGALFLIDMGNRELYITSWDTMYDTLTSGECESITDNIYRQILNLFSARVTERNPARFSSMQLFYWMAFASVSAFSSAYKRFGVAMIGLVFGLISLVLINNFTLQIVMEKGGGSAEMGTATAIQAMTELPIMFLFGALVKKIKSHVLFRRLCDRVCYRGKRYA